MGKNKRIKIVSRIIMFIFFICLFGLTLTLFNSQGVIFGGLYFTGMYLCILDLIKFSKDERRLK